MPDSQKAHRWGSNCKVHRLCFQCQDEGARCRILLSEEVVTKVALKPSKDDYVGADVGLVCWRRKCDGSGGIIIVQHKQPGTCNINYLQVGRVGCTCSFFICEAGNWSSIPSLARSLPIRALKNSC